MTKLAWDQVDKRRYETGVDHGVLYIPNGSGVYNTGFAWNGLTSLTESPTGAEATATYADNMKYLNLISVEEFGGTIAAYTYPDQFGQCDGTAAPEPGILIGQQSRKTFGLSYRTRIGNALNADLGYKIHLVWGAIAAPSEKAYETVNESPAAVEFSWEFTTTPVEVGTINSVIYKPSASMTLDSTVLNPTAMATLQDFLYGTVGTEPSLPLPAAVVALFSGSVTTVTPTVPSYDSSTDVITIPVVTGVTYYINDVAVTGTVTITQSTVVTAAPNLGYRFPAVSVDAWLITFA